VQYKNLTQKEADKLFQKFGANEITVARRYSIWKSLFGQFNNFLMILLISAGAISMLLGERVDSAFIFAIVILNAGFGLYQEFKAEKSLEALKRITVTLVRVIRDGKEQTMDGRLLVPGDLVYLEEGSRVPADSLLIKSWGLEVSEAALTGESLPVPKSESHAETQSLFMGTVVARGRAYAHITKTDNQTRLGEINATLASIPTESTPLQKKLEVFTRQIGWIGLISAFAVFGLSFVQDKDWFASFLFAVSLAVAVVPEGLPAVMTITLAIGVERMAHKKAIVRKLNAIETLGSITLVATDKTGTLTRNEMVVKKIWVGGKTYDVSEADKIKDKDFPEILNNSLLCSTSLLIQKEGSNRWDVIGDTTEGALLLLAKDLGINYENRRAEWKTIDMTPFDATLKRMSIEVKKGKEHRHYIKGSPESILSVCKMDEKERMVIEKEFEIYARKGLRMLAFAKGERFLGFVGIADPVRPEVKHSVESARRAGITVIMLTGDSPLTAEAIALETGLITKGEDIITGKQLDSASDKELLALLPKIHVFARISPEHKLRLVRLYQELGEIIAVTGDGVNDALALKKADVGVAMGLTGTDVAKETADVILTDDNFATLIHAVEEGRGILRRIQSAIFYLLSCNVAEILYILLAVISGLPVLTPIQLLYINLITDGLPAISFAFAPGDEGVMQLPPKRALRILSRQDFMFIAFVGLSAALLTGLATLFVASNVRLTLAFSLIILFQPLVLMVLWGRRFKPIFWVAFLFPLLLHPLLLYFRPAEGLFGVVPLSVNNWGIITLTLALMMVALYVYQKKVRRL
jgi:P-type Ca2+ transporter type 2C